MKFSSIVYLTKEIILEIHEFQIKEHGGTNGIRNEAGSNRTLDKKGFLIYFATPGLKLIFQNLNNLTKGDSMGVFKEQEIENMEAQPKTQD